jgi:epsilon-lactone hydrolase
MRSKELAHAVALEEEVRTLVAAAESPAAAREAVRRVVGERVRRTVPDDVEIEAVSDGDVLGEWVTAPLDTDNRVGVLVHGGAGTLGSPEESRELAARISRSAQARIFVLDYRIAPEHPLPAARDDVVATFRWLLTAGADPREIALVGESTGAALALGASLVLRDEDGPLPGTVALMSPVVDFSESTDGRRDDPLGAWEAVHAGARLARGSASVDDPEISPGLADLTGLPSLLVLLGTADPFLEQGRALVRRAREADLDVTVREYAGLPHRWSIYPHIDEATRASNQVGEFLLQRIGPGFVPVPSLATG